MVVTAVPVVSVLLATKEFYSRLADIASLLIGQPRQVATLDGGPPYVGLLAHFLWISGCATEMV